MNCENCMDTGYSGGLTDACRECEKGRGIQREQWMRQLIYHDIEAKRLREKLGLGEYKDNDN